MNIFPTIIRAAKKNDAPNAVLLASGLKIEAAAADAKGKPRSFRMVAYTGDEMTVGGFFYPIVIDLAGLDVGNSERPILLDHVDDIDHLLGQTSDVSIKGGKLLVEGSIIADSERAQQVLALNDRGFKFQASVGAQVVTREFVAEGAVAQANGREFKGPVHIARKAVLGEVSVVALGADDRTSTRIAASAAERSTMDFGKWLEAKGFTLAELTDGQKTYLKAQYDAEIVAAQKKKDDPGAGAGSGGGNNGGAGAGSGGNGNAGTRDLDGVINAEKKKEERRQKIIDLTARSIQENSGSGQLPTIEALGRQAMAGDWEPERFELELLRATRPQQPSAIRAAADQGLSSDVIEAAICLSGGLDNPEKMFKEPTLEAADKRWRHGLGLGEMLMLFARRNGHDALSTRDVGPLLRAAFAEPTPYIRASGISTLSLPNILANVANRFLKQGFDSVETTWRQIAAIRPVKDFKQVTSFSLTGDFEYIEVAPGGQLRHANVGEAVYTNQAKTYGRLFGIDRRDIINDDTNALTGVPRRLGRGGALKFNLVFWTAFMNNSSFFVAGNNNFLAGATPGTNDTRLNIEGLTAAEAAFFNQTDPDGKPFAVTPKILLVPNGLNATAAQLMNSTFLLNSNVNTIAPSGNPHIGKFTPVRSSYLSNAAITGNSTTAWYLLSSPDDAATVEAAFLNGVETPTVEQADADFNQLGIQMRGYHDFGVALQEPRGGIKMKGAA